MEHIPYTDLHIHLGGSWPLSYLQSIAPTEDIQNLQSFLSDMDNKTCTDYHICFQAFSLVNKIMNSNEKIEEGTVALCQDMANQGVTYAEIRTGLKDFGDGWESYLQAVLRGITRGCQGTNLRATVILSLKRNSSLQLAQETLRLIKKYRPDVVGLDISDDALLGDGSSIISIMPEVQEEGIPVALHLGECAEETEEQQMNELEKLNPSRIGHGVFLCEKAKEWIYSRRLPIEMCLSSAVKAHMINEAAEHPALKLLREGYPVAVCTDDPLIFKTSHRQENELAMGLLGFTIDQMKDVHEKSLQYKFS